MIRIQKRYILSILVAALATSSTHLCCLQNISAGRRHPPYMVMAMKTEATRWSTLFTQGNGAQDQEGRTPLHWAAFLGNLEVVTSLLNEETCDSINATDRYGATALHLAAYNGHTGIVKLLVRYDASVNALNCQDFTPLHLALFYDHADLNEFRAQQTQLIDVVFLHYQQTSSEDSWPRHSFACLYELVSKIRSWIDTVVKGTSHSHTEVARYLLQYGAILCSEDMQYLGQKLAALDVNKEQRAILSTLNELYPHTYLVHDLNAIIYGFLYRPCRAHAR